MAVTLKQFVHGLVQSGLMTVGEIRVFRDSLTADKKSPSVETFTRELVKQGRLTAYQVARILEGKSKGLILGNNVVLEKIGEGGMGEVFRAEHRRMKRPVVVKVLPESATESEHSIQRFQREVEAAAQLSHPNIVTAFDADEEDGIYFLVMEYVDGEDLATMVNRDGPMSVSIAVDCILQAARGLEYAHGQGMVHRDIKPDNILLDSSGVIKILDMGLARFDLTLSETNRTREINLTRDDQIVGTVDYMSPEQADDSSHVDQRSDIYSLGCTFHRLLTGQPPYQASSIVQRLVAHRVKPIPSLREKRPEVPAEIDVIFQRMIAKSPDDRYQTMTEVIHDLSDFIDHTDFAVAGALPDSQSRVDHAAPTRTLDKVEKTLEMDASQLGGDTGMAAEVRGAAHLASHQAPKVRSEMAVGIDLGTTFSAIAHLDDIGRPQTLMNAEGDKTTPSVLLFEDEEAIVGKEAVKAMPTDMEMIAECAKRDVGMQSFHKRFGDKRYPPEVLEAWILNKLRVDAQRQIGEFQKVVVTVPAYFDETRRKATQDAGYIAGLDVIDIINEPTAAAIAYGFQHGFLDNEGHNQWQTVLVYDLGGGTFDVTIMETDGREFIALATDGDVKLGGRDWDDRLVDYVAERFCELHGVDPRTEPNALGRLWRECEDAKRTLSVRHKTSISCVFEGTSSLIEITREKFQEITADLLGRTEFTANQAVQAANLQWNDIDRVLLVGGSTRLLAVSEMLKRLTGKEPDRSISPDEAVAHGAALHAGMLLERGQKISPKFTITNVNSHNLGVVGTDKKTKIKKNSVLIPRNTPLPVAAERKFFTQKDSQQSVFVQIVEGESDLPEECAQVGQCIVRELPADLPAGTPVNVRFSYEENGRLTVTVKVAGTEKFVQQEIVRENSLSQEELDVWRKHVSGLDPAPRSSGGA